MDKSLNMTQIIDSPVLPDVGERATVTLTGRILKKEMIMHMGKELTILTLVGENVYASGKIECFTVVEQVKA